MLTKEEMQEIQDLKLRGYTQKKIHDYFVEQGRKPPSRPTIAKYFRMDVVPENPGEKLAKEKAFDAEPFRSTIIAAVEANAGRDFCMSSVYDLLEEKFVDSGEHDGLRGNEQTLRNYVHHLAETGQINVSEEHLRVYDHVFDTPPGEQMLIDFGEEALDKKRSVHFMCLLLHYSRFLCVFAQDHKYNAAEACQAIYRSFCRLGGRPSVLVIDQDAVFVASETYGEVVRTRVFDDFCTEQELKLWVCNKADPESKGPIENSVGFVKKNFFSARKVTCVDDVWRSLPGWLDRKNRRLHRATLRVPVQVFQDVEKAALKPLLPTIELRNAAHSSIGSVMPSKSMELRHTISLIEFLTEEIDEIEQSIREIMDRCKSPIMTIPGISYRMGAMILAEIGDFSRFEDADKILAYAGMSPSTYQSEQLQSSHSHMEKRGSRYLRYALFNATKFVCKWDERFATYLAKKMREGKHYNVAVSHAAKKLVRTIYSMELTGESYRK